MKIEAARSNMVKQQIRACNVLDENVLALINTTPREQFVPEAYQQVAFADMNIPLPHEQVMMTPFEEANMLQALTIKTSDKVLEIGTGTGYVTALLAKSADYVDTIDIFADFSQEAEQRLNNHKIYNVSFITADAAQGWAEDSQYDVIAITGSLPFLPASFQRNLNIGGRLYVTLGQSPVMEATLITRIAEQQWDSQKLFETDLKPLINAKAVEQFTF